MAEPRDAESFDKSLSGEDAQSGGRFVKLLLQVNRVYKRNARASWIPRSVSF